MGFAMKQLRCGHTFPSANSAEEALMPSERVEQGVWGSSNLNHFKEVCQSLSVSA